MRASATHVLSDPSTPWTERDKSYVPRVKDPIPPHLLRAVLHRLDTHPVTIARAVYLFLYFGALRQSELVPKSASLWRADIQPTRDDLQVMQDRCVLYIKTGKNMQRVGQYRRVILDAAHDPYLCPVRAMHQVLVDTPTLSPTEPLFMFPDSRAPVPSTLFLKILHSNLRSLCLSHLTPKISLHSLRKAAATNAFSAGCSELSIKRYGAWSSSAYTAYINTSNQTVNQTLIKSQSKP